MAGLSIKLIGASRIIKALGSKDTILKPLGTGTKKITLKMEALTKKATVVGKTERLRSSITHRFAGRSGFVGTNVKYAPFVNYGTQYMKARHAEAGKPRVLGQGMFDYALELLHKWLGKAEKDIAGGIEKRFK